MSGTTQNDITKEYLSRGTYIFPPEASLKLTSDIIKFTTSEVPKWNPMNVCSYHLQEAGATPEQELSFALATAIGILEYVKKIQTRWITQCLKKSLEELVFLLIQV